MSHPGCLILPYDPTIAIQDDLRFAVDQELFAQSLKARWSTARTKRSKKTVFKRRYSPEEQKLHPETITRYEMTWSIASSRDGERLYGFHIGNSAITLTPFPVELAVEFVKWYRQVTPEESPVYLFTIELNSALRLTSESTTDEILRAMWLAP